MMSACGSNRLTSFSPAGTDLAIEDPSLALGDDALDQRQIVVDPGAPAYRRDPGEVGQPFDRVLQRHLVARVASIRSR